jgi:lactate dehydrogenase-like 2-hydroxyacid dehydrogenase
VADRHAITVAFRLPDEAEAALQAAFDTTFLEGALPDELAALEGAEALIVTPPIQVKGDVVKGLPSSIRAVGTYSVGMDHLDVPTIKASGRVALFTPDVLKDAVADTAILLMLGATRRATESINLIRSDEWQGWHSRQLIGQGLAGKIFGVFGMGRIGLAAAARARAFGMRIAYHNRRRLAPEIEDGARYIADANAFLAETDVLLLASPLTPDNHHYFLNDQRIAMMRPTAVVLNVGRGDIIDDNALIPALQDGRVYAAGLDVLAGEPAFDPRYLNLPNVFMLPHIGSSTVETRVAMAEALIAGLKDVFAGRTPENAIP